VGFRFRYGPGSAAAHVDEAERLGLPSVVVDDPDLAWDVDLPDDLPGDTAPGGTL
jgi:2-phospho-L-lactate guanylyltransferase